MFQREYQFGQHNGLSTVHGCEPKSLQPVCIKFSSFMPILDMSIVTTCTFITSDNNVNQCEGQCQINILNLSSNCTIFRHQMCCWGALAKWNFANFQRYNIWKCEQVQVVNQPSPYQFALILYGLWSSGTRWVWYFLLQVDSVTFTLLRTGRVRPSLFTCRASLIDLLVDLLVKIKMVVSCSILD